MRRIKIMILLFTLFVGIVGCKKQDSQQISLDPISLESADNGEQDHSDKIYEEDYIFVYVCGAVNCEGVYELPIGSRVYQAIELAGGFCEDADLRKVNQAELLDDEECIYVPVIGEEVQTESDKDGKININKASKDELMMLPGVGESRANSIIEYRETVGGFQKIEDIMQVTGIKEGLFEKIKNLITV